MSFDNATIMLSAAGFYPHSFGGGQSYVHRLAKELRARGRSVHIVTHAPWEDGTGEYSVQKYHFDDLPVQSVSINPKYLTESNKNTGVSPNLIRALRIILIETRPALLHLNGFKSALVTLCNELDIPYVVTAHHAGLVCPAATLLTPFDKICDKSFSTTHCISCCCMLKRSGITGQVLGRLPKALYRSIGSRLNRAANLSMLGRGLIYPWLIEQKIEVFKTLLKESKRIIAPSMAMNELLTRNGVASDRISLIPHGIEPLQRTKPQNSSQGKIRFGYIGRIDRAKGIHIVFKALEQSNNRDCELHIFGAAQNACDDIFYKHCAERYSGVSRIYDHGYITPDRLSEAFDAMDVLIVPSILFEVFGLVILEAFSSGIPVIATTSGGPAELVHDGVDGFLVERNSADSLAHAMQRFLSNPQLVNTMSGLIRPVRTVSEHVDDLDKIYEQVMNEHTPQQG